MIGRNGPVQPVHPGYIPGIWYRVPVAGGIVANGNALSNGSVRLLPFFLSKPIKISDLAARIVTLSAGGNIRLAIYRGDPATGKAIGTPIVETGNISTASAAVVSAVVTAPATLSPGLYFQAVNADNAVVVLETCLVTVTTPTQLVGAATLANLSFGAGFPNLTYSFASAFGAFPDLTGQALVENSGNNSSVMLIMKAS